MFFLFLGEWWTTLNSVQQVFWGIAMVFSVLFVIQFVLSLLGLDFDGDADADFHAEVDSGYSLDTDFTILSVRSIIAFFTFFGWTGVLVLNAGGSVWSALGFASLAGFAAMFIVGYMLYLFSRLSQSGTINTNDMVYHTGQVYLMVPANKNGAGKIHVKIKGSLREMDAVTEGEAISTGASIRVIKVLDENLLLVEPVLEYLSEEQQS